MEIAMKAASVAGRNMDMESIAMLMAIRTQAIGPMMNRTDTESTLSLMDHGTREISKEDPSTDRANQSIKQRKMMIQQNMQEHGREDSHTEKEEHITAMETITKALSKEDYVVDLEFSCLDGDLNTKENGVIQFFMGQANCTVMESCSFKDAFRTV